MSINPAGNHAHDMKSAAFWVFNKMKDQSVSFVLMSVIAWGLYNIMQEDRAEWKKEISNLKKERQACDDFNRDVLFKAIEANTIVIDRANQNDEEIKEILREIRNENR